MGLFNFIKQVEHKLDGSDATENGLREEINKAGLALQNFQVQLDHGLATISGQAASQKDLELARLMVGNHSGVTKVNDDSLKLTAAKQFSDSHDGRCRRRDYSCNCEPGSGDGDSEEWRYFVKDRPGIHW